MTWKPDGIQGNEQRKVRWRAMPYIRGDGLDLGCGAERVLETSHITGVDSGKDTRLFGHQVNAQLTMDVTDLSKLAPGKQDFCFSSHVLEHVPYEQVPSTLREWMRVTREGGHIVLYLPAHGLYPDPGEPHANQDHKWAVTYDLVIDAMKKTGYGWDLVDYELCDQDDEYSHFFAFKRLKNPNRHDFSWKVDPNPEKLPTACVVRYGAFGDTVQAASVCAALKKKGYHVTLLCSYPASEVVAKDPNIDRLLVQLQDQLPAHLLGHYWVWLRMKYRGKGFDKWVNLCESAEVNLLAMEGNLTFEWPPAARHARMNHNYLEFQHKLAGTDKPFEPSFRFAPTEEELKWAGTELARMKRAGIEKFILWGLAGSSRTHKIWPHIDGVFEHVMKFYPGWGIVTTGDGSCAELEAGWEGQPRIWRTSGVWNIRQVLTMIDYASVVVGPETGLLSAAAFYNVPKLVFLSHSTVENLTRDWVNTTSFYAPNTICPGRGLNEAPACHAMIPKFEPICRRHEVYGTAQCVAEIQPDWVWAVLQKAMMTGAGGPWQPPPTPSENPLLRA